VRQPAHHVPVLQSGQLMRPIEIFVVAALALPLTPSHTTAAGRTGPNGEHLTCSSSV
jgi:hypothetical protein